MVVIKIMGGLGNQLFQYAYGKALDSVGDINVFLDIDTFFRYEAGKAGITQREFQLNQLKITLPCLDMERDAWKKYFYPYAKNHWEYYRTAVLSFFSRRIKFPRKIYALEQVYIWQEKYTRFRGQCYISGYFQSPRYFDGIRDILLEELQIRDEKNPEYLAMKEEILEKEAVAVHVRRGDYVDTGVNLPWAYYRKAMEYMTDHVKQPFFYIFSDEITWVKEKMGVHDHVVYVNEDRSMTDCEELSLMRQCRHFVISNSSFSWWGAWLGTYDNKIVAAPVQWTRGDDTRDILPGNWIKIDYE